MTTEKTILVADDESHILSVVSLKLRNAGYRVLTAADGRDALGVALHGRPDLLITDRHMPVADGAGAVPAAAAGRGRAVGARDHADRPRPLSRSGRDGGGGRDRRLVSKPFGPQHLLATVGEVLACSRGEAAAAAT